MLSSSFFTRCAPRRLHRSAPKKFCWPFKHMKPEQKTAITINLDQLLQTSNAETIRTPMRVQITFTVRGRYIEGTTVDDEEHVGDGCGASSAGPLMISISYSSLKMISGYERSRWARW